MNAEDLETVARVVAAQSTGLDFDDTQQEIHIRFWEKPPACLRAAWVMARNVRNDIWRRERRHRHADIDDFRDIEAPHDSDGTQDRIDALMEKDAAKTRFLLAYYSDARRVRRRFAGRDKHRAWYYRQVLKGD